MSLTLEWIGDNRMCEAWLKDKAPNLLITMPAAGAKQLSTQGGTIVHQIIYNPEKKHGGLVMFFGHGCDEDDCGWSIWAFDAPTFTAFEVIANSIVEHVRRSTDGHHVPFPKQLDHN